MTQRFNLLLIGVVLLGAVFGGVLGDRVLATDDVDRQSIERFARLVDLVDTSYPGEVDSEEVIYGAIRGALRTLDPHSSFLEPKTYQSMREEQRGHFSGLGIVVTKKGEQLTVISPIEDTPAYRLGIRAGDVISSIEGVPTDTLSLDEAVSRLKGPKGTQVTITITRIGSEPFELTITRDDIPTKSVSRSFFVRPGVGYVRVKNFTQTTTEELVAALKNLEKNGAEVLLLDLRSNPGGLLDQAVRVSDLFLERGLSIVSTRGRLGDSNQTFSAELPEQFRQPVVVLVNQGSASASEIVAGALQDHDRALIVGQTTWGKGLVQSVYSLKYRAGLALTTAKYYTPSGRCIQRDYSSFEEYYDYEESMKHARDTAHPLRTDLGRVVYGGGGIWPDEIVELPEQSATETALERKDAFFRFSIAHASKHGRIGRDFQATDEVLEEFKAFLKGERIDVDAEQLAKDREAVQRAIEERVVAAVLGLDEGARRAIQTDPQVLKALELVPEARELRQRSQQLVARGRKLPPGKDAEGAADIGPEAKER